MPGVSSTESRPPRPIPPKRSFADFDEPDPSSTRPGTTKRLRIETEEAEQEAKTVQQQPKPLPLKRPHASLLETLVDPLPSSPAPKRYRPESVDSFVTQWVESASGSESYRGRHCRSDTLLGHLDSDIIPRRLTKSAPNMDRRDADGFALPPTPASTKSRSYRADVEDDAQVSWYGPSVTPSDMSGASTGSGRRSLVEDPYYRQTNLATNNIYLRSYYEEYPEDIAGLVDHIRKDRDSPGLSPDQLKQNTRLERLEMGTAEPAVENYFKANIFPDPESLDSLYRIDKIPMAKHAVPDVGSKLKVSTPWPDMLYGYNRLGAFTQGQQTQLISIGNKMVANTQDLILPFFVIEFKADGPGGSGSMWVATNQCLGGSASCVNIAERLNRQLRQCENKEVQPIDSAAFSIAMNGTEARLYISWKHNELDYYMRRVKSFSLQEPEQYVAFRKYVRNIIDWGKDERLNKIRDSLNSLLEESRKAASLLAKSRPPPSSDDSSVRSSSQKRKFSSSGGRNSKAKTVREYPSGGANPPPSAGFQEYNQYDPSVQVPVADYVYAPPSASFYEYNQDEVQIAATGSLQENDQYDSSVQIPAVDGVYAPPPTSFYEYNQDEVQIAATVQIPAADYEYTAPSASFQEYNQGWSHANFH